MRRQDEGGAAGVTKPCRNMVIRVVFWISAAITVIKAGRPRSGLQSRDPGAQAPLVAAVDFGPGRLGPGSSLGFARDDEGFGGNPGTAPGKAVGSSENPGCGA